MKKTILITNGRFPATLDLIRNLAKSDVRVIVAETSLYHYCSTSKANARNYIIPGPRDSPDAYIDRILEIMKEESVDLFIPAWEDVLVVSKNLDKFDRSRVFTSEYDLVHTLHNKWKFSKLLEEMGIAGPKTYLIKSKEELDAIPLSSFYLKSFYSRASEGTYLVTDKKTLPKVSISEKTPVLIQEVAQGKQYCTYSVCHNGKVTAHATYPLHYLQYEGNKSRGTSCLSFEEVEHKEIFSFVKNFAEKTSYTGSLAFDIFDDGGKLTPIECNPRLTCGVTLLTDHECLAGAYFNKCESTIFPKKGRRTQFLLPSIFFATSFSIRNGSFKPFLYTLLRTKDLIFNHRDIMPFFFQPVIGLYQIVLKHRYKESIIASYSHDLDYEGEEKAS